jgi:uncharacterized Zn finger protein (UPF0148 family)
MACRHCPGCKRRWPVKTDFFTCPYCSVQTTWSHAHPTVTAADEKQAREANEKAGEMTRDIDELERFAAQCPQLLSFRAALDRWPIAEDVAELQPWPAPTREEEPH